jgi:hypothetical protein
MAETAADLQRGALIEKKLVELQAAYLLIALRQRILALPSACAPRLVGLSDEHTIREALKSAVLALLKEIKDLPSKVTDPNWLEVVEADGEPQESSREPRTPVEARAQAAKAKVRRERKAETQRQRRAEGRA